MSLVAANPSVILRGLQRLLKIWRFRRPWRQAILLIFIATMVCVWRKQRQIRFFYLMRRKAPVSDAKTTFVRLKSMDGVSLATSVFVPQTGTQFTTCVMRTPYGRQLLGFLAEALFMSGFAVVVQDVRGRFASEGKFDMLQSDKSDSLRLLQWIQEQEWANGDIISMGWSYMAILQYPMVQAYVEGKANGLLPKIHLRALSPMFCGSSLLPMVFNRGCLQYEFFYTYLRLLIDYRHWWDFFKPNFFFINSIMKRAWVDEPESKSVNAIPKTEFYHNMPEDMKIYLRPKPPIEAISFWKTRDFQNVVASISCGTLNWAGWLDPFLTTQLDDFNRLSGTNHYIIIGPWTHFDCTRQPLIGKWLRETIPWLLDPDKPFIDDSGNQSPEDRVTLFVWHASCDGREGEGQGAWRWFPSWPPINIPTTYALSHGGVLAKEENGRWKIALTDDERHIVYNPRDPTPSIGGARFCYDRCAVMDQAVRESRKDVLVFTTPPLTKPLEVIGYVEAELHVCAPVDADVFLCLCDVDSAGVSRNVCDGIVRLDDPISGSKSCAVLESGAIKDTLINDVPPSDKPRKVTIHLGPTGKRFLPGHRIRLQVSCGAYPRYHRAFGWLNDPYDPRKIAPFEVWLLPDGNRITLPVVETNGSVARKDTLRFETLRKTKSYHVVMKT
eukprot:GEMP01028632.1.p1 GENE.GEMP01028632.1~~GEMP01028632.1.p1  ORF type:complete len:668 (+),score=113.72 GEMP01028632.1:61-2064(+)